MDKVTHIDVSSPVFPSDDERWNRVNATMRHYGYQSHALIEAMHTLQEQFGYLDETGFHFVAKALRVPLSQVYGVATFYHYFHTKPKGEHTCVMCTGTACYFKGIPEIMKAFEEKYDLKQGETSPDHKISYLTARCVGACGLAPVIFYDDELAGFQSLNEVVKRVDSWRQS